MPFPSGAIDVVTAEQARAAIERLQAAPELAVDVEADAMHAFRARLCFVQLGTDRDIFLLDTLVPEVRPDLLAPLFADPSRTKFFHAAGGDLQFLAEAGVRVKGLFDTHRAATLLGWAKGGLADLARERTGIELAKEHQQSDFSIRPLPPEMRAYIADDVRYLTEIGRQVREECRKADILEEVELDCQRLADEAAARPEIGSDWKPKLARGSLAPQRYALAWTIATELHKKRLQWAEAANIPMGRMLSNAAITAIATQLPKNLRDLQRSEGVRGAFVREHGEEVLGMLREYEAKLAAGTLPPVEERGGRDPKIRKREEALKGWRAAKASARKVTPSVVLSNALVDDLARNAPRSLEALGELPYFGEKRVRLYGEELLQLLNQ